MVHIMHDYEDYCYLDAFENPNTPPLSEDLRMEEGLKKTSVITGGSDMHGYHIISGQLIVRENPESFKGATEPEERFKIARDPRLPKTFRLRRRRRACRRYKWLRHFKSRIPTVGHHNHRVKSM
jgi:hypothetical protein